jgi:hypothetical protein
MFKHISSFNELNMVDNMLVLPRNMGIVSGSDQHVISFVWGQNSPRGKLKIPTFGATCQNSILECSNILKCWNVNFTPNSMALYGTVPNFRILEFPLTNSLWNFTPMIVSILECQNSVCEPQPPWRWPGLTTCLGSNHCQGGDGCGILTFYPRVNTTKIRKKHDDMVFVWKLI